MTHLTPEQFDRMIRFCPKPDDPEGETYMLLTAFGWSDCDDEQNEWLRERRDQHIDATPYMDPKVRDAGRAFKAFVVPGAEYEGGNPRHKLYPGP